MPFKIVPPLYYAWRSMRDRCLNPNNPQFKDYGGRGIGICERWDSYENFERDMGPKPTMLHSLDRIDNDADYGPDNCRWATKKEQMRNQRRTRWIEIDNLRYRVADLVEQTGIKGDIIVERAKRGLPYEQVISKDRFYNTSSQPLATAVRVARQIARTHCKRGHPFTPDNMYRNKHGGRVCRTCEKTKHARLRARKAAIAA